MKNRALNENVSNKQEEHEDLRIKKIGEEGEQTLGVSMTMMKGRKTKPCKQFMWDVKKQGCGGSYMAANWQVCKVNNLACQLRQFRFCQHAYIILYTREGIGYIWLLLKLLETKLAISLTR